MSLLCGHHCLFVAMKAMRDSTDDGGLPILSGHTREIDLMMGLSLGQISSNFETNFSPEKNQLGDSKQKFSSGIYLCFNDSI